MTYCESQSAPLIVGGKSFNAFPLHDGSDQILMLWIVF